MGLRLLWPASALLIAACAALFSDLFGKQRSRLIATVISVAGLAAAALFAAGQAGARLSAFGGDWVSDPISQMALAMLLLVTLLLVVASWRSPAVSGLEIYYFPLLLMSVLGAIVMACAGDLIVLYLGFEITALPLYVLVAFARREEAGAEGAMKYFMQGLLASLVTVYGMSFLMGVTGTTKLAAIAAQASTFAGPRATLFGLALLFISIGFFFKMAAAPLHFWAPDVYEGAPTIVTAAIAFVPKVGGLVALVRLYPIVLGPARAHWQLLFAVVAVVSMFVGNLIALSQTNVKRMLAYSSIAHAGYMLIGVAVATPAAITATVFYVLVYGLAVVGAFVVLSKDASETLEDVAGLGSRDPFLAVALGVFLLSLMGLPPLGGFVGKLLLFGSAVQGGFVWLAVVGVVNSVISVGYYTIVLREAFFPRSASERPRPADAPAAAVAAACLVGVVALGIAFGPIVAFLGRQLG
jgi:NADH-quinone oxidoreductase subunit N